MSFYTLLYRDAYIRRLERENKRLREAQTVYENTIWALYDYIKKALLT